jgi:uracil-DNA glycosylase
MTDPEELKRTLLQNVAEGWNLALPTELLVPLLQEVQTEIVYPPVEQVLRCFTYFPLCATRLVLLGQDPYINQHVRFGSEGRKKQYITEACGLSFSVPKDCPIPPSLRNMLKELQEDLGVVKTDGDLEHWARQNVLMLNAALTVVEGCSNSHAKLWAKWTDGIIEQVSRECTNVVFILLGTFAKQKSLLIDETKHHILSFGHPSPLNRSVPFAGCKMYSKTNDFLASKGYAKIEW